MTISNPHISRNPDSICSCECIHTTFRVMNAAFDKNWRNQYAVGCSTNVGEWPIIYLFIYFFVAICFKFIIYYTLKYSCCKGMFPELKFVLFSPLFFQWIQFSLDALSPWIMNLLKGILWFHTDCGFWKIYVLVLRFVKTVLISSM